jgi:hypothetical protein
MITTTLNRIREHSPCAEGWRKLLAHLGKTKSDDEPLPFAVILDSNGLDDALWCCRAEPQHAKEWRPFAVRCARSVQHLMTDPRSVAALDVAERHANGQATDSELAAARAEVWEAALDASSAVGVAFATARANAGEAAWAAAWAAAWEAGLYASSAGGVALDRAAMAQDFRNVVS